MPQCQFGRIVPYKKVGCNPFCPCYVALLRLGLIRRLDKRRFKIKESADVHRQKHRSALQSTSCYEERAHPVPKGHTDKAVPDS